jgi:DNA-binding NarL/FixJ family response regulator
LPSPSGIAFTREDRDAHHLGGRSRPLRGHQQGAQRYLLKRIEAKALFSITLPGKILSPREKTVLELIAQGKTNKESAMALAIAENTVKSSVTDVREKLRLENRVQAPTFAVRDGLIEKPTGRLH